MAADQETFEIVEVRFKNSRKSFYKNVNNLKLNIGDAIAVEASPGHDIGVISLVGELVKLQMKNKRVKIDDPTLQKVYRKATQRDLDIWKESRDREWETMITSRTIAIRLELKMKISDIEYQGDNSKAIFYYTAEERVDFRVLIKELAQTFSVRIEMKQIGLRQEAARVGGIGSCGRELCCSTWLTDFRSVSTTAARFQQLSLNPQKLAGQCGKLKCCLNFELDSYLDALKDFPSSDQVLKTEKGIAFFQKMDIFKGVVWYSYRDEPMNWIPIPVTCVNEILEINNDRKKATSLEDYTLEVVETKTVEFHKVVGQDDLNRFDNVNKGGKRKSNFRKRKNNTSSNNKNQNTKDRDNGKSVEVRPERKSSSNASRDRHQGRSVRNNNDSSKSSLEEKVDTPKKRPNVKQPSKSSNKNSKPNKPGKNTDSIKEEKNNARPKRRFIKNRNNKNLNNNSDKKDS